jgi:hypothetical protein
LHDRHAVMIHFQPHFGHTPRVSKVFQVVPHPPICGAHIHRLDGFGFHRHFGQKISDLLISSIPRPPTARKANSQRRIQSTPIDTGLPARNNLDECHLQCPALTSSQIYTAHERQSVEAARQSGFPHQKLAHRFPYLLRPSALPNPVSIQDSVADSAFEGIGTIASHHGWRGPLQQGRVPAGAMRSCSTKTLVMLFFSSSRAMRKYTAPTRVE